MSTEQWNLITEGADDGSALDRHLAAKVAKKLRSKWTQTDTVVVEYKHGADWLAAGTGIAKPDTGEGVTPEGGARALVQLAREFSANHQHSAHVRLNALGESQSGTTAKSLWVLALDFTDDGEPEPTPKDLDPGQSKRLAEVAVIESMRAMMEASFSHWVTSMEMSEKMASKVCEIAERSSGHAGQLLEVMRLQTEDARDAREAEAQAAEAATTARRIDKLWDKGVDVFGRLFTDVMQRKMGLGSDMFEGTYSSRLAAILKEVPEDKAKACREVLGDEVWSRLQDAAKPGVSDKAFRELMLQASKRMPSDDHSAVFRTLCAHVKPELVMTLGKLLEEATR